MKQWRVWIDVNVSEMVDGGAPRTPSLLSVRVEAPSANDACEAISTALERACVEDGDANEAVEVLEMVREALGVDDGASVVNAARDLRALLGARENEFVPDAAQRVVNEREAFRVELRALDDDLSAARDLARRLLREP